MIDPIIRFNGAALRLAREWRGMKSHQLATRIGVSATILSQWENGHVGPNGTHVQKLADCLRVPTSFFYRQVGDIADRSKIFLCSGQK